MMERWQPGPVLGIETSCDDTAAAVLAPDGTVLAERVLSQAGHAAYGGVVPEIAARAHLAVLPDMAGSVMRDAGVTWDGLSGIAASSGPGLIGGLIVGSGFAKGVALARTLPFVAINHLEAHALTARLPGLLPGGRADGAPFPYLLLLLSGGHCQCVAVLGVGRYRRLGGTIDDAVGEAFDKVAKLLGLGWPGGPALEHLATGGDPCRFDFPRPLLGRSGCDFSFSGLKTAVVRCVGASPPGPLPARLAADLAASFQAAVSAVLADRAAHALEMFAAEHASRLLVVAGGVAANAAIRAALEATAAEHGFRLLAPPPRLCTDNAVMVAWAGHRAAAPGAVGRAGTRSAPALAAAGAFRRMNYRHAFHAGNAGDCLKHALLVWLLRALARKPAPFFVLDTHAGIGRYDLDTGPASRTDEWQGGIGRLLDEAPPPLADYVGLVRRLGLYPGSPAIARALLRPGDRLACCELHPEDAAALRRAFSGDRQVAIHHRDGYEALAALLPPRRERRGLVLIDPPYEQPDEFSRVAEGLRLAHARFPTGILAAWYPIKHRAPVRAFHAAIQAGGLRDVLAAELFVREPLDPERLNGSGMVIVSPPYLFEAEAPAILAALLDRLGSGEAGAGTALPRLAEERPA